MEIEMRAPYSPLRWVVEVNTAAPNGTKYWESIAAFDAQSIATSYADACGATGSADLYRVSLRTGMSWVVIHTCGRASTDAIIRNHPATAPVAGKGKPASVSA